MLGFRVSFPASRNILAFTEALPGDFVSLQAIWGSRFGGRGCGMRGVVILWFSWSPDPFISFPSRVHAGLWRFIWFSIPLIISPLRSTPGFLRDSLRKTPPKLYSKP